MKKFFLVLFVVLLVLWCFVKTSKKEDSTKGREGVLYTQNSLPYITKLISFNLPLRNTDESIIEDLKGINVYYSFEGETNFVKGSTSPNLLTNISINEKSPYSLLPKGIGEAKIGSTLIVGTGDEITVTDLIMWEGVFDDSEVWVRVTAIDAYDNESAFSDVASILLSNVNLTEQPRIVKFELRDGKIQLWIDKSNGQEFLEIARDLIQPETINEAEVGSTLVVGTNGWAEVFPLKVEYDFDEIDLIFKTSFFRIRR